MKYLLLLGAITIAYTSCIVPSPVENCTWAKLDRFEFNATDTIRDDSATLYRYRYGSGFAQHTHVHERHLSSGALTAYVGMTNYASPDTFDWKIVLHPSEKTYYIKNILFTTKKVKYSNHTYITCTEKMTYTVNDEPQEYIPYNPSAQPHPATLPIKY